MMWVRCDRTVDFGNIELSRGFSQAAARHQLGDGPRFPRRQGEELRKDLDPIGRLEPPVGDDETRHGAVIARFRIRMRAKRNHMHDE